MMDYSWIKLKHLAKIKSIIENEDLEKQDKDFEIISLITGISVDKLESMPFEKSNKIRAQFNFIYDTNYNFRLKNFIFVKGRWYRLLTDVRQFSAGRFLSIKAAIANGGVDLNLNKIAALCYKPLFSAGDIDREGNYTDLHPKRQKQIYNDFENAKVSQVAGGVFFYLNVSSSLSALMQIYLNQAEMEMMNLLSEKNHQEKSTQNITDGGI